VILCFIALLLLVLLTGNVISSSTMSTVVRQSTRLKVAPLRWWVGERMLFSPVSGTRKIVSGYSLDTSDISLKVLYCVLMQIAFLR